MTKVRIEMDEGFNWFPVSEDSPLLHAYGRSTTMDVPEALILEYQEAVERWTTVQEKLEQLYRVQEGLTPWTAPPIPEHVKLAAPEVLKCNYCGYEYKSNKVEYHVCA